MTDPVNAAIVEHFHTTWKVIPFPRNTCASCSKAYTSVLGCHSGSFSFPMQHDLEGYEPNFGCPKKFML